MKFKEVLSEKIESSEEKNERFSLGNITEEEIKSYWKKPEEPLFKHNLKYKNRKGEMFETPISIFGLTEERFDSLSLNFKESWGPEDLEHLKWTVSTYFEQKKYKQVSPLNVEYYVAVDKNNEVVGMTGLYTVDINGGAGFVTKNLLDSSDHNLSTGLGWFSVSDKYQGRGLGSYLFDWSENLSKTRGAKMMLIETDDYENEEAALKLYEKRGYKRQFNIDNYFGEGRDLRTYYLRQEKQENNDQEKSESGVINKDNRNEILLLAQEKYSPERFEEFRVCLDLFLKQDLEQESILKLSSVVVGDKNRKVSGFSIFAESVYDNSVDNFWDCAVDFESKKQLIKKLKKQTGKMEREVIMLTREGDDDELEKLGFRLADKNGIPFVFGKDDSTNFLIYAKKL